MYTNTTGRKDGNASRLYARCSLAWVGPEPRYDSPRRREPWYHSVLLRAALSGIIYSHQHIRMGLMRERIRALVEKRRGHRKMLANPREFVLPFWILISMISVGFLYTRDSIYVTHLFLRCEMWLTGTCNVPHFLPLRHRKVRSDDLRFLANHDYAVDGKISPAKLTSRWNSWKLR